MNVEMRDDVCWVRVFFFDVLGDRRQHGWNLVLWHRRELLFPIAAVIDVESHRVSVLERKQSLRDGEVGVSILTQVESVLSAEGRDFFERQLLAFFPIFSGHSAQVWGRCRHKGRGRVQNVATGLS